MRSWSQRPPQGLHPLAVVADCGGDFTLNLGEFQASDGSYVYHDSVAIDLEMYVEGGYWDNQNTTRTPAVHPSYTGVDSGEGETGGAPSGNAALCAAMVIIIIVAILLGYLLYKSALADSGEKLLYYPFYSAFEVKTMITLPIPSPLPPGATTLALGEEDGGYYPPHEE